jgi:two-component system LytT family response regulator
MLRAIIIDDEQKGINALKMLIAKHIENVKIIAQCTRAEEGIESIENYKPDIVFLDINMPGINGFELLEKLTWKDFNLIFTTAYQEFGLKALKNNAIDYLLKPIDPEELQLAINRVTRKLKENESTVTKFNYKELNRLVQQTQKQRIMINSKSDVESIEVSEIIRLESKNNYTLIYLTDAREILIGKSLKEFEMQLCTADSNFMRVHQSFIINLNKVLRYLKASDCVIMSDAQKIPISKGRKGPFFKWLNI